MEKQRSHYHSLYDLPEWAQGLPTGWELQQLMQLTGTLQRQCAQAWGYSTRTSVRKAMLRREKLVSTSRFAALLEEIGIDQYFMAISIIRKDEKEAFEATRRAGHGQRG